MEATPKATIEENKQQVKTQITDDTGVGKPPNGVDEDAFPNNIGHL
jgi:hypothetical protein